MTQILAPFSAPPNVLGLGAHRLEFVDGACTDPGLNAGERAYLLGLGYRFVDDEPAKAPAKTKAAPKSKAAPKPTPEPDEGDEAGTDTDGK